MQQVSVLPYRNDAEGLRFLLITSRRRGRWILAKGWPKAGDPLAEMAGQEAFEEAGVHGEVAPRAIGHYRYIKRVRSGYRVPCAVSVYPMRVTTEHADWPERGERRIQWVPPAEAATLVAEPGLRRLLRRLSDEFDEAGLEVFLAHPRPLPADPPLVRLMDRVGQWLRPSAARTTGPESG
ncbi:NUDIX hydrolase [Marivibrio halodurans]|uniref:NUDIX hydrolase n=1 Tax=Marivibrio halodurans TaxID=2039722 RepID=A0A8J7SJR3_9PROT|nr:NUDIX hydrolase [Marivibrio halodurans]